MVISTISKTLDCHANIYGFVYILDFGLLVHQINSL